MRATLRAFLASSGLAGRRMEDVLLAVGEAASNAIEHAYRGIEGEVRLRAYVIRGRLVVEVHDRGRWRLDGDPERGRGLGIMHALVDRVSIESSKSGTSVRLELGM